MATAVRAACRLQPLLRNILSIQQPKIPALTKSCEYYSCRQFSLYKSLLSARKYTEEHEWVLREDTTSKVTVGITDYAQSELGDIVFVDLPVVGDKHEKGETIGAIESVKAVSDVFAPVTGEILEVNKAVEESPEIVNTSPLDEGWLFKVAVDDITSLDSLMAQKEYDEFIHGQ